MYDLAYRQTCTYGGILSLLRILEIPVHRICVSNAELTLAANLFAQNRSSHDGMYDHVNVFVVEAHRTKAREEVSYCLTIAKGDASNAWTVSSSKVFASEFFSMVHVPALGLPNDADEDADALDPDAAAVNGIDLSFQTVPDLAIVPDHCTGKKSLALWLKRFQLQGIETYQEREKYRLALQIRRELGLDIDDTGLTPAMLRVKLLDDMVKRGDDVFHIELALVKTDAGSDERGARNLLFIECAPDNTMWLYWGFCLHHQAHLHCKRQLTRTSHHGMLAKRTNVWRASGNPNKMYPEPQGV